MGNELALRSMDEIERAATAMSKSGYFQDAREVAQCVTKILAGREMGFGPFASMTGVYIIQGRPSIGANLMAAAVKASGRYNYRVREMTDAVCNIEFFEGKESIGFSKFTLEDARKAGTKNLDKFARNMLFARAMSNGCRWYCPDVFNGAPTYTPEELGANVNEDGQVIDVIPTLAKVVEPEPTTGNGHEPEPVDLWDEAVLDALAQNWNLAKPRLMATLRYCTLPKSSTLEIMSVWMQAYKAHRDAGEAPAVAAESANAAMREQV